MKKPTKLVLAILAITACQIFSLAQETPVATEERTEVVRTLSAEQEKLLARAKRAQEEAVAAAKVAEEAARYAREVTAEAIAAGVMSEGDVLAGYDSLGEEQIDDEDRFKKWRLSIGGVMTGGLKTNIKTSTPRAASLHASRKAGTTSKAEALMAAQNHEYPGGGFIKVDEDDDGILTSNWKLPSSAYNKEADLFSLANPYSGEVLHRSSKSWNNETIKDDDERYGLNVEMSGELWSHKEDHKYGIDVAFGGIFTKKEEIYRVSGGAKNSLTEEYGAFLTDVEGRYAMYDYNDDPPAAQLYPGFYGEGEFVRGRRIPCLDWRGIHDITDATNKKNISSSVSYGAYGDYRDIDITLALRPWYELKDWWRLYAIVGLGAKYSEFDYTYNSSKAQDHRKYTDWDIYGFYGLGTIVRYKRIDFSVDGIIKFDQDDFEIDEGYAHGSIGFSEWQLRAMIGFEF